MWVWHREREVCPNIELEKVAGTNSSSQQHRSIIHLPTPRRQNKIITPKADIFVKCSSLLRILSENQWGLFCYI